MDIYINNVNVSAEILPINNPTLDESLETFSFSLVSNTNKNPIAPMNEVRVEFDDVELYFYVVSDSVEIYSMKPIRYKHKISCVQNTRILSRHLVRNTVITQPPLVSKYAFLPIGISCINFAQQYIDNCVYIRGAGDSQYPTCERLSLNNGEKFKKVSLRIDCQLAIGTGQESAGEYDNKTTWQSNFKTLDEINSIVASGTDMGFNFGRIALKCRINNVEQTITTLNNLITRDDIVNTSYDITGWLSSYSNIQEVWLEVSGGLVAYCNSSTRGQGYVGIILLQFYLETDTYYYSCYDVLDLLNKRYKQEYDTTVNIGGGTVSKDDLFVLPSSGETYNLLRNTIAPNLTFTQLTMYECVAEVFRLFDSIFTMDENKVLQIERFNKKQTQITNTSIAGYVSSISEDNYVNRLETYYQDGRIEENFPGNGNFAPLRSENYGVADSQDHYFILPHKIDKIVKVETIIDSTNWNSETAYNRTFSGTAPNGNIITWWLSGDLILDISHYIVESNVWSTLDLTRNQPAIVRNLQQNNTLFYSQGDNKIFCAFTYTGNFNIEYPAYNVLIFCAYSRLLGMERNGSSYLNSGIVAETMKAPNWQNIRMRVSYICTVDGKTRVESIDTKYNGETLVDQNNGAVDLNKLGLNMLGLSLKLGEPSQQITMPITSWENRVKPGDYFNLGNDGLWIANVCSHTILGDGNIQTKVSFVKNFNALALYTRLNRIKRMTNISSNLIQKSEDIITNYIYFEGKLADESRPSDTLYYGYQPSCFENNYLAKCLYLSFTSDSSINFTINFACLYNDDIQGYMYIPLIKYGGGNTINFEVSFDNPMSAGNKTTYYTSNLWFGQNKFYTTPIIYTDEDGFMNTCTIHLLANTSLLFSDSFPAITETIMPGNFIVGISNYKVYKQPNEIFALNYQLAFLTLDYNNAFVGTQFINNNFFVNGKQQSKSLRFYFSTNEKYDILETKGKGIWVYVNSVQYDKQASFIAITFNFTWTSTVDFDYKSWAICDSIGNILFAFNEDFTTSNLNNGKATIYFITRTSRL